MIKHCLLSSLRKAEFQKAQPVNSQGKREQLSVKSESVQLQQKIFLRCATEETSCRS